LKFRIPTKTLAYGLARLKSLCSARASLPILSNVLIRAEKGRLMLEGSNLDHHLTLAVPATVDEPGAISVTCSKLQEGIGKMHGDEIAIETAKDGLVCRSGGKRMRLVTLPPEEFPPRPAVGPDAAACVVPAVIFAAGLEKALPFVSTDETRYVINGVYVVEEKGRLRAVATDGKRLICVSPESDFAGSAIFTTAAIKMICDLVEPDEEDGDPKTLDVRITEGAIHIDGEDWSLAAKRIEGNYPEWRAVIPPPTVGDINIVVDRAALLEALPFVQVMLREKTGCVKLQAAGSQLLLATATADVGEATAEIAADVTSPITVGYNASYVIDAMNVLTAERAIFAMASESTPARIEEPGVLIVLMPMILQK
jgi:DNA polymerase-3 subunit beta